MSQVKNTKHIFLPTVWEVCMYKAQLLQKSQTGPRVEIHTGYDLFLVNTTYQTLWYITSGLHFYYVLDKFFYTKSPFSWSRLPLCHVHDLFYDLFDKVLVSDSCVAVPWGIFRPLSPIFHCLLPCHVEHTCLVAGVSLAIMVILKNRTLGAKPMK